MSGVRVREFGKWLAVCRSGTTQQAIEGILQSHADPQRQVQAVADYLMITPLSENVFRPDSARFGNRRSAFVCVSVHPGRLFLICQRAHLPLGHKIHCRFPRFSMAAGRRHSVPFDGLPKKAVKCGSISSALQETEFAPADELKGDIVMGRGSGVLSDCRVHLAQYRRPKP